VASPTRDGVHGYDEIRNVIEQSVGQAVGEHGRVGHVPIHYLHQNLTREELAALYLAADVMLVTPLRDGMNLVAKEYVTVHDHGGALVLSEFAGAAAELTAAWLVNPYDVRGVKLALMAAIDAGADERRQRMRQMSSQVASHDVHRWARTFVAALHKSTPGAEATAHGA
jgi:trehalose 6-phosphate synthase